MEIKILCVNRTVCEDVIKKLRNEGFDGIKEIDSPSFDIVAKLPSDNKKSVNSLVDDLFDKCKGKIQTVQIS